MGTVHQFPAQRRNLLGRFAWRSSERKRSLRRRLDNLAGRMRAAAPHSTGGPGSNCVCVCVCVCMVLTDSKTSNTTVWSVFRSPSAYA